MNNNILRIISQNNFKLRSLIINWCNNVTNEGIKYLHDMKNLKELNIRGCIYINQEAVNELKDKIKTIKILNTGVETISFQSKQGV